MKQGCQCLAIEIIQIIPVFRSLRETPHCRHGVCLVWASKASQNTYFISDWEVEIALSNYVVWTLTCVTLEVWIILSCAFDRDWVYTCLNWLVDLRTSLLLAMSVRSHPNIYIIYFIIFYIFDYIRIFFFAFTRIHPYKCAGLQLFEVADHDDKVL